MDNETKAVMKEAEKITRFTDSDGWGEVRGKLVAKIMDLQSILNIDPDPAKIINDVASRTIAVTILKEWLDEIEGIASQHKAHEDMPPPKADELITTYEN